jgi:hypothetical protein
MRFIYSIVLCLLVSSVFAEPIPSAKEMQKVTKEKYNLQIQKAKVKFREECIDLIIRYANDGKFSTDDIYFPDDREVYKDFCDELIKLGYKFKSSSRTFIITWYIE